MVAYGTLPNKTIKSVALCYLSPQGTTGQVGRKIASLLSDHGFITLECDLSRGAGTGSIRSMAKQAGEASLLVVGTPVYADHAVYPVVSFLKDLPDGGGKPALAYVTFGGVSAGVAAYEVTDLLRSRGYSVKGVTSVLCVHSMMFGNEEPVGGGTPTTRTGRSWANGLTRLRTRWIRTTTGNSTSIVCAPGVRRCAC